MKYQAIYKCRLCGEKFNTENYDKKPVVVKHPVTRDWFADSFSIDEKEMHYCDNGDIGIADFQGFKVVEE